jgi:hypothetical protein
MVISLIAACLTTPLTLPAYSGCQEGNAEFRNCANVSAFIPRFPRFSAFGLGQIRANAGQKRPSWVMMAWLAAMNNLGILGVF